mgnify:CR=1 FL=1
MLGWQGQAGRARPGVSHVPIWRRLGKLAFAFIALAGLGTALLHPQRPRFFTSLEFPLLGRSATGDGSPAARL